MSSLVSIIIPAYNRAHLIERTLQSVVAQTYPHWELIVVDDGSTDATANVVEAFIESYTGEQPLRLIQQANQGVSVARNTGLAYATGQYVCFLDSDDAYHPQFLEATVQAAQAYRVPIVFTGFNRTKPNKRHAKTVLKGSHQHLPLGDFDFLAWQCHLHLNTCLFERGLFTSPEVQFTAGVTLGEDTEVMLKLLHTHPSVYVNQVLFHYHVQPDSATRKPTPYMALLAMYTRVLAWLEREYPPTPECDVQQQRLHLVRLQEALGALKHLPRHGEAIQQQRQEITQTYVASYSFKQLWRLPRVSVLKKLKLTLAKWKAQYHV
ncbi:MAG: glycosyltransferase family 2 protein [Vampirovibrionales bacterium]